VVPLYLANLLALFGLHARDGVSAIMTTALRVFAEDTSPCPSGGPGADALATVNSFFDAALVSAGERLAAALQDPLFRGCVPFVVAEDTASALMADVCASLDAGIAQRRTARTLQDGSVGALVSISGTRPASPLACLNSLCCFHD